MTEGGRRKSDVSDTIPGENTQPIRREDTALPYSPSAVKRVSGFNPLASTNTQPWFGPHGGATPELPRNSAPEDLRSLETQHPSIRATVPVLPMGVPAGVGAHRKDPELSRTLAAELATISVPQATMPLTTERVASVLKDHERLSGVDVNSLVHSTNEELLRLLEVVLAAEKAQASLVKDLLQSFQRDGRKLKKAWRCDVTGGLNKTGYLTLANAAFDRASSTETPFSLIILDLNFLKAVNDNLGEKYGDVVLKLVHDVAVTELQRAGLSVYSADNKEGNVLVSKYGGDEYGVCLPGMTLERAADLAEKIRKAVEKGDFEVDMPRGYAALAPSTINGAVLQAEPDCPNYKDIHKRAASLHSVAKKRYGRNIIVRGALETEDGLDYVMVTPEDRYEPETPDRYATSNANTADMNGLPMPLKRMIRGFIDMLKGIHGLFGGGKKPKKALPKD